jgi:ArsR family transcriptional regulator
MEVVSRLHDITRYGRWGLPPFRRRDSSSSQNRAISAQTEAPFAEIAPLVFGMTLVGANFVELGHHRMDVLGTDLFSIFIISHILWDMSDALRQFKSEIFQGLANPTRIAIVELLRDGELSAGTLIEKLRIEQANASQHLAVLRAKQIVVSRKVGNQVYYSIRDRALIEVLDTLRRYFYAQLDNTVNLLREAAGEQSKSRPRTHR